MSKNCSALGTRSSSGGVWLLLTMTMIWFMVLQQMQPCESRYLPTRSDKTANMDKLVESVQRVMESIQKGTNYEDEESKHAVMRNTFSETDIPVISDEDLLRVFYVALGENKFEEVKPMIIELLKRHANLEIEEPLQVFRGNIKNESGRLPFRNDEIERSYNNRQIAHNYNAIKNMYPAPLNDKIWNSLINGLENEQTLKSDCENGMALNQLDCCNYIITEKEREECQQKVEEIERQQILRKSGYSYKSPTYNSVHRVWNQRQEEKRRRED